MYQRAKRNTQAYRNKVIFGDTVLIDLTADTVTPDKILSGFTAHDQSGAAITGTCEFDVDSGDATVQVAEIIKGQTAYARGAKLTGTMTNNGAVSLTISTVDGAVTIPQGYHDGSGKVQILDTEKAKLIASNIKQGMVNAFIIRFFSALMGNIFVRLLLIAVCADMVFGSLRAAKYRKWNSAVGIDGAIRKAGMLACVLLFTAIDMMMHVDVLDWLPVDTRNVLDACGVVKMGVTELFALLFILYEATSVLKNMLLCGLPVPAGLREKLGAWLSTMTEETKVDIVAEQVTPAPIADGATADAVRRAYEDDCEESGLLE